MFFQKQGNLPESGKKLQQKIIKDNETKLSFILEGPTKNTKLLTKLKGAFENSRNFTGHYKILVPVRCKKNYFSLAVTKIISKDDAENWKNRGKEQI